MSRQNHGNAYNMLVHANVSTARSLFRFAAAHHKVMLKTIQRQPQARL